MHISGFYIIIASMIWGVDGYIRQKIGVSEEFLIAFESTVTGIFFLLFVLLFHKNVIGKIRHTWAMIGMILFEGIAGSWCFMQAISNTESLGFVFILIGLQPLFTILSSAVLLGEHPRGSFYAFAATTFFASILLTLGDTGFTLTDGSISTYLYALLTALFWGMSTTLSKIAITDNSQLYIMTLRFIFTGLIGWCLVFFLPAEASVTEQFSTLSYNLGSIIFIIFISDIIATSLYFRGLDNTPATLSTIFELAFPLTGFVLDYILYDVIPTPMKVVAAFVILLSIVILPHCHFLEGKNMKKNTTVYS